jgi:hypothetical protein
LPDNIPSVEDWVKTCK